MGDRCRNAACRAAGAGGQGRNGAQVPAVPLHCEHEFCKHRVSELNKEIAQAGKSKQLHACLTSFVKYVPVYRRRGHTRLPCVARSRTEAEETIANMDKNAGTANLQRDLAEQRQQSQREQLRLDLGLRLEPCRTD